MLITPIYAIIIAASLVGLALMWGLMAKITSLPVDDAKAAAIAAAIRLGAMTFLREEYRVIALVVLAGVILLSIFASIIAAACFAIGSLLSLTAGFIGMRAATLANVRTTLAAHDQGERAAFLVAFCGGGVMGFAVASIGLLGLTYF